MTVALALQRPGGEAEALLLALGELVERFPEPGGNGIVVSGKCSGQVRHLRLDWRQVDLLGDSLKAILQQHRRDADEGRPAGEPPP